MNIFEESNQVFWDDLAENKTREELLELVGIQNPDLIMQVKRIEWVFANKLGHLNWPDGSPIEERPLSNYELSLLIDPIFKTIDELLDLDISATQQKELHIASDTVMWARHVLNVKPRVYQILMLRHPNRFKVLRAGRRLGKTFCMALKLMHYSYVNKGGKSIVIAPMVAQANLIYKEIMKLAKESNVMMEAIERKKASPPAEIDFTNGSEIIFFTSGMKTGSKADATRGQEAHLIILDEVDYMGDDDLDAILAMMQKTDENQPEKQLIGASTPTGRRAVFYDWCFPAGTFITTENGLKKIEDIDVDDLVLSEDGNIDKVSRLYKRDYSGLLYKIKSDYILDVESTANHPHFVKEKGFISAEEIEVGDFVKVPVRPKKSSHSDREELVSIYSSKYDILPELLLDKSKREAAEHIGVSYRTLCAALQKYNDKGYFCDDRRFRTYLKALDLLKDIEISSASYIHEMMGLYLAEGHILYCKSRTTATGVCWTFNSAEQHLVDTVCKGLSSLNLKFKISNKEDIDTTIQVLCNSAALGELFRSIFKEKELKCVPAFVDNITPDLQRFFLKGVFEGDGCLRKTGRMSLELTAKSAVVDIYYILLRMKELWSIKHRVKAKGKRDSFILTETTNRYSIEIDTTGFFTQVRSVETRKTNCPVYNFETKNTHTYTANLIATHNCNNPKSGFKEFWFPSYANPYFDKETEDALRGQYSELGWRHEIEADWGEDAQGVYPKKYVDTAFSMKDSWDYELYPGIEGWDPDSFFVIGVDWDKYGAGTNIVVLQIFGKNPRDPDLKNKVIMYYREEVPRDEYTFTKATQRIVELNSILNPRHIYIDRGAGEVQAEMLHLHGKENPATGLHKKVKGIQFGESIEVREPYTRELTKKPIKPYMVDNLRLFLERKQIIFPNQDEELHLQLISYIVIRENESGRPVFEMSSGKIGDHAHDALILACYAITENYGELHNLKINFQGMPLKTNLVPKSKDTDTIAEDKEEESKEESIFSISRSFSSSRRRSAGKRISRSMF